MAEQDLFSVIGKVSGAGYCSGNYWVWETEIAQPALEALGY
jgi:hypothetical protein